MLGAIVEDFARLDGIEVMTSWDSRLGSAPFQGARVQYAKSPEHEWRLFRALAAECDAALVIAPEFDRILQKRCRAVESCGGRLLGPSSETVAACADKFRLARRLAECGIATIPTDLLSWRERELVVTGTPKLEFPAVIKPRDGAGSLDVRLIESTCELSQISEDLSGAHQRREFIIQPYVRGRALSVAMFVIPQDRIEILPVAEQLLSDDGMFRYLGGRIPAAGIDRAVVEAIADAVCRSVSGLRGYVGIDLLLPDGRPQRPLVVEVNPRLTTSYLGYRRLAAINLAEWFLVPERSPPPVKWHNRTVEFAV